MSKSAITTLIVLIIVFVVGAYFILRPAKSIVSYSYPYPTPATNNQASTTPTSALASIKVISPTPYAVVSNPLTITGEARGNWYFEGSFPVKLLDANGKVLIQGPAQAQGDWMTTNFVPFRATLVFGTSTTATGTLVLEKDNPSGLPENAAEFRIPIRFR